MKIIAVDFDGTIAKTRYPHIVELIPEAHYIAKWRRMGHKVVLWTCRMGEPLELAVKFCQEQGIQFDGINENVGNKYTDDPRKISADIYIDDKCPMPVEEQWNAVNSMLGGSTRKTVNANVLAKARSRKG
jgi:hydroxymethylpyrimidine pyrophosphatase-like HAD family hydrolase